MISVNELNLTLDIQTEDIRFGDIIVTVQKYLPIDEKTQLIQYVVNSSLDDNTGCFSPLRVEVYFALGVCKWYTDIEIEDLQNTSFIYDLLETNGVISAVMAAIPEDELEFIRDLINDTVKDIARYNSSAAGIIHIMSGDTKDLDSQLQEVIQKVGNGEGLEFLKALKDMVKNS